MKNYLLTVGLSKEAIMERIKKMNEIVISLEKPLTDKLSLMVLSRRFWRLKNGLITLTVLIEEKEIQSSEITLVLCSPFSEGFWGDMYAAKSIRSDFLKQLEPNVINMEDTTPEELKNNDWLQ